MFKRILLFVTIFMCISVLIASTAVAATIDNPTRTVTTDVLFIDWSETSPEEIVDIRWRGSPNLTNIYAHPTHCTDEDLEYFGNSWVSQDEVGGEFVFKSIVGWGMTAGTWEDITSKKIRISSYSIGCPGSAEVDVQTTYKFFDSGPAVNKMKVNRRFSFGPDPFPYNFRPYIPRLYPRDEFNLVLHPDSTGTNLVSESGTSEDCEFGCMVTDWDGSWFAIHNPTTGQGMIVRHETSPYQVALWIDADGGSSTTASSVLLLQPIGGFTGTVMEVEFFCFYDNSTWSPSLELPPGC